AQIQSSRSRPTLYRRTGPTRGDKTMNSVLTKALQHTLLATGLLSMVTFGGASAFAQDAPVRVGLMLPSTGTYAALGTAITNGFKQYVNEQGGALAGRKVEYFEVDDESDPAKAAEKAARLIKRDRVDLLVGTVHSGVALA